MKYIKQEGIKDCGVACLYNIVKFHKGNISIEKLRKLTDTNEKGTSIYNLVKCANEIGFESKAYKCEINDLNNLEFPIIAYIKLNNYYHFVIIDDIDIDKITVFDPIRGLLIYNFDNFSKEWQNIIITFKPKNVIKENTYFYNYLKELVLNNKKLITFLLSLYLISTVIDMIYSLSLKNIFNNFNKLLFFIIIILKIIFCYFRNNYSLILNNKVDIDLFKKVYNKLFSLPYIYYHNRPVGDITSKINDLYVVKDLIFYVSSSLIVSILSIIFILIILLFSSFKMFIFVLICSFIYFLFNYYFVKEENKRLEDLKNKNNDNNSLLIENILGIDTIKNLNIETKIIEKQNKLFEKYIYSYNKYHKYLNIRSIVLLIITYYPIIMLFMNNSMLNGTLLMYYTLIITYFTSINDLNNIYKKFVDSKLSLSRLNSLLNYNEKDNSNVSLKEINNIDFSNVNYKINNKKIINNFNLMINKGDYVLVSGESGIGKSSIFKLLNKDYVIDDKSIFINNIDINKIKEDSLKSNICYVSQDEYIYNDTIKNNILMFKNINNKDLNKVLKVTMIDKFLKNKKINLNYMLEENGHNLSGGERQKILLARTLVRNIDYIVLDETTSEIDIESERKIIENIKTEYTNKTLILISHRLSNEDLFNKRVLI